MKVNKELVGYIRERLRKGMLHHEVKLQLLNHGWRHIDIYPNLKLASRLVAKEKKILTTGLILIFLAMIIGISLQFGMIQGITGYSSLGAEEMPPIHTADDASPHIAYIPDVVMTEAHNRSFIVYACDDDGERLNFSFSTDSPSWVSIRTLDNTTAAGCSKNATANLTLSPPNGIVDTKTVTVIVRSTSNDTDSRAFQVTVGNNNAPSFVGPIPNQTWPEDTVNTSINLSAYFSDAENDTLTYTVITTPTNITVNISSSSTIVTLTPNANFYGNRTVTFRASDGIDTTNSNLVYLNVTAVQDIPQISSVNISPSSAYINSNLSCFFYVVEHDRENTTANVSWYRNISDIWVYQQGELVSNCSPFRTCYAPTNISYTQIDYTQLWNCSVFLNDSVDISTTESTTIRIMNAPPFVTNITDNSNSSSILTIGDTLIVNINWYDLDNDNATLFVCNSTRFNSTKTSTTDFRCIDATLCSKQNQSSSPSTCNYTLGGTITYQNNYSVFACDNTSCSGPYNESFFSNRPPALIRNTTTLTLNQSRVACSGVCDLTADNKQTFWKFKNTIPTTPDVMAIENMTLITSISTITGNWSKNLTINWLSTNASLDWNSTSTGENLAVITLLANVSFDNVTNTGANYFNISNFKWFYPSDTYLSIKLVNPEANTVGLDNATNISAYFPVGNNKTKDFTGEIRFANNPTILVSYNSSIPNQSWYMNVPAPTIDLDNYFYDPDGDSINYTITAQPAHIAITLNAISHVVSFLGEFGWYGTEYVVFNATDSRGGVTSSNRVALTVLYVEGVGEQETTTVSSGGSTSTEVASLDIIIPEANTLSTGVITVPFTLRNSGAVDLTNINLSTFFEVKGLMVMFDDGPELRGLAIGESYNSTLTLITKDVTAGKYSVQFIADVLSPKLVETSTIYINVGTSESANESIEKQIEFAEDLFKTNPECLELLESIYRAKEFVTEGHVSEARRLLDTTIRDCRDLLSQRPKAVVNLRNLLSDNWEILLLIIITLFIIYVAIIVLFKY